MIKSISFINLNDKRYNLMVNDVTSSSISLSLKKGKYKLEITGDGFETYRRDIDIYGDLNLDIPLIKSAVGEFLASINGFEISEMSFKINGSDLVFPIVSISENYDGNILKIGG